MRHIEAEDIIKQLLGSDWFLIERADEERLEIGFHMFSPLTADGFASQIRASVMDSEIVKTKVLELEREIEHLKENIQILKKYRSYFHMHQRMNGIKDVDIGDSYDCEL